MKRAILATVIITIVIGIFSVQCEAEMEAKIGYIFTCDGCGEQIAVVKQEIPSGWIAIAGSYTRAQSYQYDNNDIFLITDTWTHDYPYYRSDNGTLEACIVHFCPECRNSDEMALKLGKKLLQDGRWQREEKGELTITDVDDNMLYIQGGQVEWGLPPDMRAGIRGGIEQ